MKDEPGKQFSLRLGRSLKDSAFAMAKRDGVSLNHFISLAVAEKVSRIDFEQRGLSQSQRHA
jgi:predicted HicB family RNase H-like nuclease